MELVLDLYAQVRLPEFAKSFVSRAADMMGAQAAALAMFRDTELEIITLQEGRTSTSRERSQLSQLARAFGKALEGKSQPTVSGTAGELLGDDLASAFGWRIARWCGCWAEPGNCWAC